MELDNLMTERVKHFFEYIETDKDESQFLLLLFHTIRLRRPFKSFKKRHHQLRTDTFTALVRNRRDDGLEANRVDVT